MRKRAQLPAHGGKSLRRLRNNLRRVRYSEPLLTIPFRVSAAASVGCYGLTFSLSSFDMAGVSDLSHCLCVLQFAQSFRSTTNHSKKPY